MDCIIVGGGPAGLTSAIYLARFRRHVAVIDSGDSRARLIPKSHNYPGFAEGITGPRLLELLRRQAEHYGVNLIGGYVERLDKDNSHFTVQWSGGKLLAPRVIMATGLVDKCPPIPRLAEAIASGLVRYCPICDGFEASDQRIAVLGHAQDACAKALFLRSYSQSVTLVTLDGSVPERDLCTELERSGVIRPLASVSAIAHGPDGVTATLVGGEHLTFDILYPVLGCDVRSQFAVKLGAKHSNIGTLLVDPHQQTTVSGLYAIGDVVSDLHQLAVGTGHAAVAATHVHHTLPRNLK